MKHVDTYLTELWRIFPDEDFCMYIDFPFSQLVIIYRYNNGEKLTCTYLYLVQFYEIYHKYIFDKDDEYNSYTKEVLNLTDFKSISKCNFEQRKSLCNKSNYQVRDYWDKSDFSILNKKIQIAFKISLYPIALFGVITNFIVVLVILTKENTDLFKGFKQYTYLWLNSLFCMIIFVIELLSWMTECFYPFEVFCPEIRKIVAIQFFKIIFKECFVTMLRFMCNFTYVAFALNRISLIGREHGKIVTFMSELGVKKYIGISIFISCLFSWIKGFKYKANYLYSQLNYPMSVEMSIIEAGPLSSYPFYDFFFLL